MKELSLTGHNLTLNDLITFEQKRPTVSLAPEALEKMEVTSAAVGEIAQKSAPAYGINTGFGALAGETIAHDKLEQLQYNLLRSHACGVGVPFNPDIVRRIMLLKANSLAAGASGVRPVLVTLLVEMLNKNVLPFIPSKGSVGASGDLAPLAHMALVMIGEGKAWVNEELLPGAEALKKAGLVPIDLHAKEGLALLNGTQVSAALAIRGWVNACHMLDASIAVGALSVEGLAASYTPFDARISQVRNMGGQIKVAEKFRGLLTESEIHQSHQGCERVQDPYALRCMPQVLGAVQATLDHAQTILAEEINSVTDNPLIFGDEVLSGGNFHAEPLAFISDFMGIAVSELGSISERRTDLFMRRVNKDLPMFLANSPGLESGLMIAHVTAAALASENKTLAHPASVDSIPTSAGQEDHVSMAPWAGQKLNRINHNVSKILAIELLSAIRAVELQAPKTTTPQLRKVIAEIRAHVPIPTGEGSLHQPVESLSHLLREGLLSRFV